MPVKRIDASLRRHGTVGLVLPDPVPASEQVPLAPVEVSFDTDEWDGVSPFWQHAVAGSVAGVFEHSVMFPVDTVKTHMQVNAATRATLLEMVQAQGVPRMWRGVQTMFAGCVPAHAAYFSIYEGLKPLLTAAATRSRWGADQELGVALGAGAAVSIATVAHDLIMTPMDVMKQRLQLGHHHSIGSAFSAIMREHGPRGFVVSLPLTLAMNMPHAGVMGTSNEFLKQRLAPAGADGPGVLTHMVSGACAGALAAAATNPLDVIKTRLQTQHLTLATATECGPAAVAGGAVAPAPLVYSGVVQACAAVFNEAGLAGFYRGVGARMLAHAPSVAICWTTYETAKHALQRVSSHRQG